jgi:F-type H+-transporting ATPase subunit a
VSLPVLLAQEPTETNPFQELLSHLIPHHYGWAPDWTIGGFNFSITNAVLNMWIAVGIVIAIFWIAASKPKLVPRGVQNFVEVAHDFVKDQIVYSVMSPKDARTWFPFIGTIFFFVVTMNLVGLIPYIGFTPTGNIFVTGALALSVWLLAIGIGMAKNGPFTFWKKTLLPEGIPKPLIPLMIPIEIVSQIARPMSLAVRLFANMFADHTILLVFLGFIFLIGGGSFAIGHLAIVPVALVLEIVFMGFAIFIAFIQAVIFAFLSAIYINEALHPGH